MSAILVGFLIIAIFIVGYTLVALEEFTHLRKSKPTILAAGLIWAIIAVWYASDPTHDVHDVEHAVRHYLTEFAELFLFLLAAMTYVNAMSERNVFAALRGWLVSKNYTYRQLFWITGALSFFLSPVIDNLTTALVMCAVIMAVGRDLPKFVSIGCINIVVAANAGGAFSPFGDITTLMVWQKGILHFGEFFNLFIPAVVTYLIPAIALSLTIPSERPATSEEITPLKRGAKPIIALFACTIITAVSFHNFLHLPPFLGMMTGLAYLQIYGYYLKITHIKTPADQPNYPNVGDVTPFDSFEHVARAEWDTLLFFFGIIMCVGGLGFMGYLANLSELLYTDLGPTIANIFIGMLSSIVDNIPVMVAVLEMKPDMNINQWLLVTLTTGVGGSMLSVGSAAGVALMGQARGIYTFFGHLKWTPIITVGYFAAIGTHLLINGS